MPVCADPAAVLEQQVPMYHLDDDHRYIMIMGVGPEGSDGNYQSFAPFQIPIEYDYDVLDLKHIIQAQLGYEPDEINLRVAGDFRPDESKLGPIFGRCASSILRCITPESARSSTGSLESVFAASHSRASAACTLGCCFSCTRWRTDASS